MRKSDGAVAGRSVFPTRKTSRWYDAALALYLTLGLVLVLCPFIVIYLIDDAQPAPISALFLQSLIIFLFVFSISAPSLFWRWQTFRFERIAIDETGCGFVGMFGRRHHLPWEQVTGVRYNVFLDALILETGGRRVSVPNSFVEPDLVVKFVLKRIPDCATRSAVVEFLDGAFLHGRIEATGPWTRRLFCHIAYVRWGGVTRVPKL